MQRKFDCFILRATYVETMEQSKMQKKLTITVDEQVYNGLHSVIGSRKISQFIESLVRPHVIKHSLEAAYCEMAQDEAREVEALEWSESTIGDVADETR